MYDIKFIRKNPQKFDEGLQKRGEKPCAEQILQLDEKVRSITTELQVLQTKRNEVAKQIGLAKSKGEDAASYMQEAENIKSQIPKLEQQLSSYNQELESILVMIPNMPADDVPLGADENSNVEVRAVGEIPHFSFTPKSHHELGEALAMMDFKQTAKISGSRFVTLKSDLAKLERALANFMLDTHTEEFGYVEHVTPQLVREDAMFGVGQLPKFAEDSFATTNGYRLIPTSEVTLTNMVADSIIPEEDLPLRFVAYSQCFRSEAGSAGRDTTGMIRNHQFSKVELVSITRAEESVAEHERMTKAAETILQKLKLPYRTVVLCSGDMGFCAVKTYDLEVWLPSQNKYREISSCSNCGDFQARRMNARYRDFNSKNNHFVHTLNGSGLAIGRTIVAILENYQNEDGSITIPEVLRPYMKKDKI